MSREICGRRDYVNPPRGALHFNGTRTHCKVDTSLALDKMTEAIPHALHPKTHLAALHSPLSS